jgi:putative flippase GtrA
MIQGEDIVKRSGTGPVAGEAEATARPFVLVPRFVLFLLVGGLNTAFGYGAFALLYRLGLHYALAAALSTIAGVLFNFQTTGRIVFKNGDRSLLVRFVAVYVMTYFVNVGALRLAEGSHLGIVMTQAFLLLPMAALSYVLQRRFVFGREVAP